jgi:queuine tRNA-ribosyltransferase
MLLTWHNLAHYQKLMEQMRQAIAQGRLPEWANQYRAAAPITESY